LLSEVKSLKTNSKDYQARFHSDQMVLMISRREAGQCEQRLNSRATISEDAQMRVGKQLLAAKNLTGKQAESCLNKSQLTISRGVLTKRELLSIKMMIMSENQPS
jgi:hypothetical protein